MGNSFDDHRDRMDKMRRQHELMSKFVLAFIALTFIAIIGAGGWLLTHPEQIGAFVGRVASGYNGAQP